MENLPAMKPPPGKASNFDQPHTRDALTYGVLGVALGLTTIALALRIYGRWFVVRQPFLGDCLWPTPIVPLFEQSLNSVQLTTILDVLIAAYAFFVSDIALVFKITHFPGIFIHQYDLRMSGFESFLHDTFNATITFSVFVPLAKAAIFLEWLRIFVPPGSRSLVYWACHTLMWANIIFYALMIILVCSSCRPFEYSWNRTLHGACHINTGWTTTGAAAVNFITDVFILILPQNVIWKLQMTNNRKLGVAAIFSIGILGVTSAGIRLGVSVVRATSKDFTYTFSSVLLCALAEGTCAMLVVCGPSLPKAFSGLNMAKVASTMRSWVGNSKERLLHRSRRGSEVNLSSESTSSWMKIKGSFTGITKSSKRLDDQRCVNGDEHHLVPLPQQPLRSFASGPEVHNYHDRFGYASQNELGNSQILRSTQFELAEDCGVDVFDKDYQRQH